MDHDGFAPAGLGTSQWIPGAASSLQKAHNPIVSYGQTQEPLRLVWKKDQPPPELCPGQQLSAGCVFESGAGKDGRGLDVALESRLLL